MLNTGALTRLDIDAEEGLAYCADDPDFYEEKKPSKRSITATPETGRDGCVISSAKPAQMPAAV